MFKQLLVMVVVGLMTTVGTGSVSTVFGQGIPSELQSIQNQLNDLQTTLATIQNQTTTARTIIDHCQTINTPGSYVLVNSLQATGDCIVIASSDVTLDLNGQTLSGAATGSGITDSGVKQVVITIRNGTVRSFETGFNLGASVGSRIEKVQAVSNAQNGIVVEGGSIVKDCLVLNNGFDGIAAPLGGVLVAGNLVISNGIIGIDVFGGASTFTGNTVNGNNGGVFAGPASTLTGNTVSGNVGDGIAVTCPSNLVGNTAEFNGTNEFEAGSPACNKVNNLGF